MLECVQAALDRLCGADPSNAGWQRDLWVSHGKMAYMLERSGEKGAIDWWRRALAVLSAMKAKGLFISPNDEKALDFLRLKCGEV